MSVNKTKVYDDGRPRTIFGQTNEVKERWGSLNTVHHALREKQNQGVQKLTSIRRAPPLQALLTHAKQTQRVAILSHKSEKSCYGLTPGI